jgi:threonine synthase
LICFDRACRARYAITEVLYNCPKCGGLLEAAYGKPAPTAEELKALWRGRMGQTIPVEANFDQILALMRQVAERLGIYLLNSMNPYCFEFDISS